MRYLDFLNVYIAPGNAEPLLREFFFKKASDRAKVTQEELTEALMLGNALNGKAHLKRSWKNCRP